MKWIACEMQASLKKSVETVQVIRDLPLGLAIKIY